MRTSVSGILTLSAIACVAYLVADVTHEGLGHGGACLALGGKLILLSTTYADCSIRSRLIDGAGPVAGLVVALFAWTILRIAPPRSHGARAFLCLVFAFAALWNVGYMIKSGLLDQGDWAFVIAGIEPSLLWHAALAVLGVALYAGAMRMLGKVIVSDLSGGDTQTPFRFTLTALAAAVVLSALAAVFDPRGAPTIFTDALPSSLGSIGLVWVGWVLNGRLPNLRVAIPPSPVWIATGIASAVFFVGVLGPGVNVSRLAAALKIVREDAPLGLNVAPLNHRSSKHKGSCCGNTGRVRCAASFHADLPDEWVTTDEAITYKIERTTDGRLCAIVWGLK
jgi:hypothetical protein